MAPWEHFNACIGRTGNRTPDLSQAVELISWKLELTMLRENYTTKPSAQRKLFVEDVARRIRYKNIGWDDEDGTRETW